MDNEESKIESECDESIKSECDEITDAILQT